MTGINAQFTHTISRRPDKVFLESEYLPTITAGLVIIISATVHIKSGIWTDLASNQVFKLVTALPLAFALGHFLVFVLMLLPPMAIEGIKNARKDLDINLSNIQLAGFWKRVTASVIDILLISVCLYAGVLIYSLIVSDDTTTNYLIETISIPVPVQFLDLCARYSLLIFVLWVLYSSVLEATPLRATLGKYILGICVIYDANNNGFLKPLWFAILRFLCKFLNIYVLGLGYFWVAISKRKRAWHDMMMETDVVKRPKQT